jgi:protein-L-isoaspartate(D-aspartate) O-methyltransferase
MSLNMTEARALMIEQQLRAGAVLDDRVLATVADVPRENFVPDAYRGVAFADDAIPLASGQSMMTPLQEGLLLQALGIQPTDHVLEIGTGSGYLTACLGRLATHVTSIEVFPELADRARERLQDHGIANCEIVTGDAFEWSPRPADAIAVTGSVRLDDDCFLDWLKPGGRLFRVVGDSLPMRAWLIERVGDTEFRRSCLFETFVPPLVHAPEPEHFIF